MLVSVSGASRPREVGRSEDARQPHVHEVQTGVRPTVPVQQVRPRSVGGRAAGRRPGGSVGAGGPGRREHQQRRGSVGTRGIWAEFRARTSLRGEAGGRSGVPGRGTAATRIAEEVPGPL